MPLQPLARLGAQPDDRVVIQVRGQTAFFQTPHPAYLRLLLGDISPVLDLYLDLPGCLRRESQSGPAGLAGRSGIIHDLGHLLVTVDVPPLGDSPVLEALAAGAALARALREAGLCHDAILVCQGWVVDAAGTPRRLAPPRASPDAAPVALAVHA